MADLVEIAAAEEALLGALKLPTRGRIYRLGMQLNNDKPLWPAHGPFLHYVLLSYTQGGRLITHAGGTPNVGMLVDRVEMPLHAGTHVDSLNHFSVEDRLYDGSQASEVESSEGATALGLETMDPFVCPGLLLDIAAVHGVKTLSVDHEVTDEDLRRAMKRQGIASIRPGSVVITHTGWMALYETDRRKYLEREPGLGMSGALMLAEAGIRAVAADNSALELVPPADHSKPYPVHQELLARRGVHIFENVVSAELAADGVGEFLFVAAPLVIRGASGSPVTPLAIV